MTQAPAVAATTTAPADAVAPGQALAPVPMGPAGIDSGSATRTPEISTDTGEVRRPPMVGVSSALLGLGAALTAAFLVRTLLAMTGDDITAAGWIVRRINPPQSSLKAVLMPVLAAALILPAAVASGLAAFHSWNGRGWARIVAAVGAGLSLLALLYGGPLSWAAIAVHVVGAGLAWLPRVRRYHVEQTAHLAELARPAHTHTMPAHVHYGPVPRYRS